LRLTAGASSAAGSAVEDEHSLSVAYALIGSDVMPDTPDISEARRALLEKYLRGDIPQSTNATNVDTRRLEAEEAGKRERVVPVQTGGSRRPFFFLHGDWTDKAFFCYPLAHYLGPDQPFYVLEPYSFDGLPVPPTLETMAAAHIKSMRAVQPEGPYLLGGFCNGGLTAYEMARQLEAEGQKVDLLVLMDSVPARFQLICEAIRRIGKLMRLGRDKQLDWFLRLEHAYRYLLDRKSDDFEHIKTTDPRICSFFPPVESLRKEYPAVFYWSTSNYRPGFYPGKVSLFWDAAEPVRRKWWDKWAKGQDKEVEVHVIPGSHTTCKTEHLQGMAEHLHACLCKVQAAALSE
jgi:thioesterase superfamily protein